jgi:hypothetical protein
MSIKRILLDSNVYLRLAHSFHPLLHEPFGKDQFVLFLIPEFQKEFDKNPRLANKFGWVDQPEYIENRKHRVRALAYGDALEIPVVTDDSQMRELSITFGIEVWSLLDLLQIMYKSKRIELSDIKTLLNYLKYIKDWPYPSFAKDAKKVFKGL